MNKEQLFESGLSLAEEFCAVNAITMPKVIKLFKDHPDSLMRRYYACIGTCAFYRPTTIHIAVSKCATPGMGGRAWSWPAYAIDRTPYGVIQHELGHHIDHLKSAPELKDKEDLFSYRIWLQSKEEPLTGYLGTDGESQTYFKEWFAENFRLFVTNHDLSARLRPKFHRALSKELIPISDEDKNFETVLRELSATDRIIAQAWKKVEAAK